MSNTQMLRKQYIFFPKHSTDNVKYIQEKGRQGRRRVSSYSRFSQRILIYGFYLFTIFLLK